MNNTEIVQFFTKQESSSDSSDDDENNAVGIVLPSSPLVSGGNKRQKMNRT